MCVGVVYMCCAVYMNEHAYNCVCAYEWMMFGVAWVYDVVLCACLCVASCRRVYVGRCVLFVCVCVFFFIYYVIYIYIQRCNIGGGVGYIYGVCVLLLVCMSAAWGMCGGVCRAVECGVVDIVCAYGCGIDVVDVRMCVCMCYVCTG